MWKTHYHILDMMNENRDKIENIEKKVKESNNDQSQESDHDND